MAAFRPFYAVLDFQINREYIAANLCENQELPIPVCGGKCYLVKNLKKSVETPESNNPSNHKGKSQQQLEELLTRTGFEFDHSIPDLKSHKIYYDHYSFFPKKIYSKIFLPPPIV